MNVDCDQRIYNPYGVYLKSYYISIINNSGKNDLKQIEKLQLENKMFQQLKQQQLSKEQELKEINEQLKYQREQEQEQFKQFKQQKQQEQEQLKKLFEQQQHELLTQIDELKQQNKAYEEFDQAKKVDPKMAALQLGEIGESWIYDVLKDYGYVRTGSENHVCDGHIEFENSVLLFEIKNKIKIKSEDLDKFKYDIEYYTKNKTNKKVFGVFISLNSDFQELVLNVYESYIPKSYVSKELLVSLVKLVQYYDHILGFSNDKQLKELQLKLESLEQIGKRSINIIEQMNNVKELEQQNYDEIQQQINILKGTLKHVDLKIQDEENKIEKLKKYLNEHKKWKCCDVKILLENNKPNGLKSFSKKDISEYINNYLK